MNGVADTLEGWRVEFIGDSEKDDARASPRGGEEKLREVEILGENHTIRFPGVAKKSGIGCVRGTDSGPMNRIPTGVKESSRG